MSQRNHDPTETGIPECSTTGTLREIHIIIGNGDRYYSFWENQTLPLSENHFATSPEQIHFSPVPGMIVAEGSTAPGKAAASKGKSESVACTVCQHFGIDTSDYSFGYITGWSSGKEAAELKESLGQT